MQKILQIGLAFLLIGLAGCGDDEGSVLGPNPPSTTKTTLTFVNSTSYPLELVCWAEPNRLVWFDDTSVWDSGMSKYVSAVSIGGRVTREVQPSSSAFAFYFVNYGQHYRTVDLVTVQAGKQVVFEMKNTTLVGQLSVSQKQKGFFCKQVLDTDSVVMYHRVEDIGGR